MMDSDDVGVPESGIIIPYEELSEETLHGIIAEFVLREGTEYGVVEITIESKIKQVLHQLEHKEAFVVFDASTETCDIKTRREIARVNSKLLE